uniref:Immunoglobulin domain-containing protein n=1 Tax=Naja naja TaxID=35670 RepID=A0A8C6YIZ6_NAJNA
MSPILEPFCPFSEKIFLESEGQKWEVRRVSSEELTGILGESVTFQVKISPPFEAIAWNKIPCSIVFFHPEFQRRVNISRDCRELHLSQLKKEDAGRYTAEIVLSASKLVRESFDLKVFSKYPSHRRLLDSEMKVTCTGVGNGTWKLNCSTGTWEDGVKFSWPSDVQSKNPPLGNLAIFTSHDLNLKVTCAAENLVSNASTTVSLKKVCAGKFFSH